MSSPPHQMCFCGRFSSRSFLQQSVSLHLLFDTGILGREASVLRLRVTAL